jgi:hypothetical protein
MPPQRLLTAVSCFYPTTKQLTGPEPDPVRDRAVLWMKGKVVRRRSGDQLRGGKQQADTLQQPRSCIIDVDLTARLLLSLTHG